MARFQQFLPSLRVWLFPLPDLTPIALPSPSCHTRFLDASRKTPALPLRRVPPVLRPPRPRRLEGSVLRMRAALRHLVPYFGFLSLRPPLGFFPVLLHDGAPVVPPLRSRHYCISAGANVFFSFVTAGVFKTIVRVRFPAPFLLLRRRRLSSCGVGAAAPRLLVKLPSCFVKRMRGSLPPPPQDFLYPLIFLSRVSRGRGVTFPAQSFG